MGLLIIWNLTKKGKILSNLRLSQIKPQPNGELESLPQDDVFLNCISLFKCLQTIVNNKSIYLYTLKPLRIINITIRCKGKVCFGRRSAEEESLKKKTTSELIFFGIWEKNIHFKEKLQYAGYIWKYSKLHDVYHAIIK